MNDIGLIDFETSSPIFFDPYHTNRVTGSFILIDPISNATVAAGMIEGALEDQASSIAGRRKESGSAVSGVTPEDRYAGQGHYPAVIAIHGRAALAGTIERALFDAGFRVVCLNAEEFSAESFDQSLRVFQIAGLITIVSRSAPSAEAAAQTRQVLASERHFDSQELGPEANDDVVFNAALAFADTLRIRATPEVN
jgi:hypothetical protein